MIPGRQVFSQYGLIILMSFYCCLELLAYTLNWYLWDFVVIDVFLYTAVKTDLDIVVPSNQSSIWHQFCPRHIHDSTLVLSIGPPGQGFGYMYNQMFPVVLFSSQNPQDSP